MSNPAWFVEDFYLRSKLLQLQTEGIGDFTTIGQVRDAILDSFGSVFDHFLTFSLDERTSPNQFFNTTEYLEAKALQLNAENFDERNDWTADDVQEMFSSAGFTNAYEHFQRFGWQENVNPSNAFDVSSYLESKAAQLDSIEQDGRTNWTSEQVAEALAAAGLDPVDHFIAFGEAEGITVSAVPVDEQVPPAPAPEPGPVVDDFFNQTEYLEAKARQLNNENFDDKNDWTVDDVAEVLEGAGLTAYDHFHQFGWLENVNPSNAFDVSNYLDSKAAQLNTIEYQGRIDWTAEGVSEVFAANGLDPIQHYLRYGQFENGVEVTEVPEDERVDPAPGPDPEVNEIDIAIGNGDPNTAYLGTAEDDVFIFDVEGARASVPDTQFNVFAFDLAADAFRFNLADGLAGETTLDQLPGLDAGIVLQENPFTGSTVVTFGPDGDGDIIAMTLVGITLAETNQVAVEIV